MAKKSVIQREFKREKIVESYKIKRKAIKEKLLDSSISDDERWQIYLDLYKQPRNASKHRLRRRCCLTGRPRGVYRKFGLSRTKLRELVMEGLVPGVKKSSW